MTRVVRLYFRILGVHLRSILEYESDFWIMVGATFLMQVVNVVFLSAIFSRVPTLNGWSFWGVVAMFAMVAIAEGFGSFFFEGVWQLAIQLNQGDLDYMLVRPYPVVLQVTGSAVGINGLTNIVTGGIMLTLALSRVQIDWSPVRIGLGILLFVCAILVKLAINIATNAVSFWLVSPSPMFAMAIHQVGDLARFPLAIYPLTLKVLLGFIVPFAFVSVFPVNFVLDADRFSWLGLLTPLVAAYCLWLALVVFRRGMRRYESAGN